MSTKMVIFQIKCHQKCHSLRVSSGLYWPSSASLAHLTQELYQHVSGSKTEENGFKGYLKLWFEGRTVDRQAQVCLECAVPCFAHVIACLVTSCKHKNNQRRPNYH
jgi:hypothetical protein